MVVRDPRISFNSIVLGSQKRAEDRSSKKVSVGRPRFFPTPLVALDVIARGAPQGDRGRLGSPFS